MSKYLILLIILVVGCTPKENKQNSNSQNDAICLLDSTAINEVESAENLGYIAGDTICWELQFPYYDSNGNRFYKEFVIESKEDGAYFVLSSQDKEYQLSDIFDYGEFDMLIYKHNENKLLLLGLVDFYGSTYFIYHLQEGKIKRIGDLSFSQAEDVERTGSKQATFNIQQINNVIFIDLFLDNIWNKRYEKYI